MRRQYFRKDELIEVEAIDDVIAVRPAAGDGTRSVRASELGTRARAELRELDDDEVSAFQQANWEFVKPNAQGRAAVAPGGADREAWEVGQPVLLRGGRLAIATDLLNVQLRADLDEGAVAGALTEVGLEVMTTLRFAPNLFEVRSLGRDALDASVELHDDPRFVFAEPSFVEHVGQRFTPTDPEYAAQWQWANSGAGGGTAGADVNIEPAWDRTFGAGVRVAVIDNGFDADHDDLAGGVSARSGFFANTSGGVAFTQGTAGMPDSDHGTFCAGIAAARRGGNEGGVGAAPDSELVLIACLGDQVGTQTTLARAVSYAADPTNEVASADPAGGADVLVSSLGPNGAVWDLTTTLELAIEDAAANGRQGRGLAIFWAASNGTNVDVLQDEVVSHADVIAVVRSDRNDMENNAARGAEVELIAPGVDVRSTGSGNVYRNDTGTSFAAPCAAGCAALALSVRPELTRDQLRTIMRETADQIGGVVYDANGHNDDYGFGRVNAWEAVKRAARRIQLTTPSVVFNDVPEGETTARAIVWQVEAVEDLTFEVVSGPTSTPSGQFAWLLGSSVTVPAPGVGVSTFGRLWLTHTGTTAGASATGQVVVRCVQTGEQWTVNLSANTIARPTTAVVMVMDRSGSMVLGAGDGRQRVEVLRESAAVLVDVLKPDTGIGIVRFDHDANDVMAVVDAGPEIFGPGRAQATAAVASHVPNINGGTSIGDGVERGGLMLDAIAGAYDETAMIVLTDGQETSPKWIADVAGNIDDQVFAIGLGEPSSIDPQKLTALTNGTGGYVTMTGVLSQDERFLLAKYYLQILAGVTNEEIVLDPSGHLPGGASTKVPFSLARADATADVILLSPAPGVIRFVLETPNGELITPGSTSGASFVSGQNVAYYRFTLPIVDTNGKEHWGGEWLAHLECDERTLRTYLSVLERTDPKAYEYTVTHGLQYAIEVHARSSLKMTAALDQPDTKPGTGFRLVARLDEFGIPLDAGRAKVRAELTGPAGNDLVDLVPVQDGRWEAEYVAKDYGLYRFRIVAEGYTVHAERFTREQTVTGSIYVARPPEEDPVPKDEEGSDPPHTSCDMAVGALVSVLTEDRRLAKLVDSSLQPHGVRLDAVLRCLGGGRRPARPALDIPALVGAVGSVGAFGAFEPVVPVASGAIDPRVLAASLRAVADVVDHVGA